MTHTIARTTAALGLALGLTTAASAFDTPSVFTRANVLAAGNYNDGFNSSDLTLIIQLEAGGKVIFDEGADVMYHITTGDVDGWTTTGFDDGGWEEGITGIGYGDGDDNTEVLAGEVTSLYTRYHFDLPGASDIDSVVLRVDYDDSYILWLNGTEIARTANIATLSASPEIPAWDVSSEQWSMPHIESTGVPAGKPNNARWDSAVHPFEQDLGGTIHQIELSVEFGGDSA